MYEGAQIEKPLGRVETVKENGYTPDIIKSILEVYEDFKGQTKNFSTQFQGGDTMRQLSRTWNFVKNNIQYIVDPNGIQKIKSPAVTWWDKYGDCKSYSILIGSILHNLKIPHIIRFSAYESGPVSHVYVVAIVNGQKVFLDCCMNQFNKEKKYHHIKDYNMTKIVKITGIGDSDAKLTPLLGYGNSFDPEMSEGELSLRIARQRMEIERALMVKMRGIGSPKVSKYTSSIEMLNDAIDEFRSGQSPEKIDDSVEALVEAIKLGHYNAGPSGGVNGVGKLRKSKVERKAYRSKKKEVRKELGKGKDKRQAMAELRRKEGSKTAKFLQKAADTSKKGLKAIVKVVTAPGRLLAKGILEIILPKAAPFFLYLFVAPSLLEKLPAKARAKRKKAEKLADFIVNSIGMKRAHFMGIVRNGIMAKMGKAPEVILQQSLSGKVSGIGFISVIPVVIELISKIAQAFGKRKEEAGDISESDMPGDGDFAELSEADSEELGKEIRSQSDENFDAETGEGTDDGEGEGGSDAGGGRKSWSSMGK